jgi:prophage regulatory protein
MADRTLPQTGFVRLQSILRARRPHPGEQVDLVGGGKSGRYPKPVKLGPRITAWRVEDIRALIDSTGAPR